MPAFRSSRAPKGAKSLTTVEVRYKLVGEAYVHGMMNGRAVDMMRARILESRKVDLI